MSRSGNKVPDSWDDDDWVEKADEEQQPPKEPEAPPKKLTKAERRAIQAEFNRQLWQEAETPEAPYYVDSRYEVPVQSTLRSNVTLLARKPAPNMIARKDPITGLESMTLEDDEGDEDDDEGKKKAGEMSAEERMLRAQREREEKQKRYEEARERLFGPSTSDPASPRSSTPPVPAASARGGERGGRGGGGGGGGGRGRGSVPRDGRDGRADSLASGRAKQLFDPNSPVRSDSSSSSQKKDPAESPIIRNPRGPDGSGRGGIGFVNRGGRGP